MSDIQIRTTTLADAATISEFNRQMAMETENKRLAEEVVASGVKRLMERPEYGFYLVATNDDEVVGSCMITMEWTDWRDGLLWWIQSVYVKPDFRKQGVYTAMYRKIRELAALESDVHGFRLYVEKDNRVAQKAYEKLGMKVTDYLFYEAV